jgi:hypothetical protein
MASFPPSSRDVRRPSLPLDHPVRSAESELSSCGHALPVRRSLGQALCLELIHNLERETVRLDRTPVGHHSLTSGRFSFRGCAAKLFEFEASGTFRPEQVTEAREAD